VDVLVVGEYLIERKGRYVPNVVRHLMLGAGVVTAGVMILRVVMNISLLALVALPTVAAAVVGVALKDTAARFRGNRIGPDGERRAIGLRPWSEKAE
jgi:small-conductance mechanosensitive channel